METQESLQQLAKAVKEAFEGTDSTGALLGVEALSCLLKLASPEAIVDGLQLQPKKTHLLGQLLVVTVRQGPMRAHNTRQELQRTSLELEPRTCCS